MGIKFIEESQSWEVSRSERHPITRQPRTLRRKCNDLGQPIKSKAEAQRVYNEMAVEIRLAFQEQIPSGAVPYRELLQKFYQSLIDRDLSNATIENYRLCLDAHTGKLWGHRPIDSIKTDEIRQLIKVKLSDRSRSHQKSMLKFVRGVFNYAVEAGYLMKSPVPFMQFRVGDKFKPVLTEIQAGILLEKAKQFDHDWYPHWAMALYTGMRNEELYALTWDNVNFEARLIYIRRVWTKKDGFKELTKSGHDRVVEIALPLVTLLKEQKLRNPDSPYVLPRIDGWTEGRQAEFLRVFLMGLNLPPISFHNLRATWATIMLSKGVEPVKVMKMGGWSSLKTLEKHYIRLSGVDIKGATDDLQLHDPSKGEGQLIKMRER